MIADVWPLKQILFILLVPDLKYISQTELENRTFNASQYQVFFIGPYGKFEKNIKSKMSGKRKTQFWLDIKKMYSYFTTADPSSRLKLLKTLNYKTSQGNEIVGTKVSNGSSLPQTLYNGNICYDIIVDDDEDIIEPLEYLSEYLSLKLLEVSERSCKFFQIMMAQTVVNFYDKRHRIEFSRLSNIYCDIPNYCDVPCWNKFC